MSGTLLVNLAIAALLSALLYIILKFFTKWKVVNLHGLTFNYLTASTFAFANEFHHNCALLPTAKSFILPALGIGLLFIIVFYTAALTAQKSGIAITSIAGKMSMVIPITAGVFLYQDQMTLLRIIGIALALVSVYLASVHAEKGEHPSVLKNLQYPILLFLGSGCVDTCIKLSQHYFINNENQNLFFCFLFGSAGVFGTVATLYNYFKNKIAVSARSIFAGIFLGIVNYYSLLFLVKCLATTGAESALIWAMTNMLVVIFSSVLAFFIFKEKLSRANQIGISLALIAIFILSR